LSKQRSPRWHTIYSIISTLIEEALIIVVVLWLLPLLGINIPGWGLLIIIIGFAIFSYAMYLIGHPTISYRPLKSAESIIGRIGIVESDLNPEGYVKIEGELWKASAGGDHLVKGTNVIVVSIDGLTLKVKRMPSASLKP
jgi:membrane protein implicated in regulation of membrane protease activity